MSGIDIEGALGIALDEFDQMHEYPVETDDGMVMRCACGATPPSHLLGQQVDEGLWLWEHWRAKRRAHVAAVLRAQIEGALAEARELADELCAFNPGHGDFLTAGARLQSLLGGDER